MKEWCLKHPILTFFLADQLIAAVENVLLNKRRQCASHKLMYAAGDAIDTIMEKDESKKAEKTKQPIGFAA